MIYNAPSEADAIAVSSRIHQYLSAADPVYAENVAAGHTTGWDTPLERDGAWSIQLQPRCLPALTPEEQARVTT